MPMSLFKNLSGSTKMSVTVRAQFKDEKYFISQIDRCNRFIKNDSEDFELFIQKNGKLKGSHYITAAQIRNKKIENAYSKGEKTEDIIPVYNDSFNWFIQGLSDEYQGYPLLLQMVSFAVLFGASDEKFKMLSDFCNKLHQSSNEEIWKPDSLVFFLLGETNKKRKGIEPYEKLYQITQLPKEKAEEAIGD